MVLWQHVVLCGWCFRICYDRSSPCLSVSSSVLYGIGILNECILIQHARWKTKKKICNYLRLLLTSNNASEEIWPLSARALCVWLPHLLIPVGLTMEVRAISSAISAVRCRWCMFLSCPLKLQRGAAKRLVISTDHFCVCIYIYIYIYTGCPRRNVPDFGRVFLMLKYTDITRNTYVQSWTVTEIMAREIWKFDSYYTLIDYQIHIKTGRNMSFL